MELEIYSHNHHGHVGSGSSVTLELHVSARAPAVGKPQSLSVWLLYYYNCASLCAATAIICISDP